MHQEKILGREMFHWPQEEFIWAICDFFKEYRTYLKSEILIFFKGRVEKN